MDTPELSKKEGTVHVDRRVSRHTNSTLSLILSVTFFAPAVSVSMLLAAVGTVPVPPVGPVLSWRLLPVVGGASEPILFKVICSSLEVLNNIYED